VSVRISQHFGLVVRKGALERCRLTRDHLLELMEAPRPMDEDVALISFGPHFGEEASDEFVRRLKHAGLEYVDDFFVLSVDAPDWCAILLSELEIDASR
jgi:hypothetical protein